MPYTEKQRVTAAIALHNPSKLYKRNRGMLAMTKGELKDFSVKSHLPKGATQSPRGDLGADRAAECTSVFRRPIKNAGRGTLKAFPYRKPETAKDTKLSVAGDEVT